MNDFFIVLFIIIFGGFLTSLVYAFIKLKKGDHIDFDEKGVLLVKVPTPIRIIMIFCTIFGGFLILAMLTVGYNETVTPGIIVGFSLFTLFSLMFVIGFFRFKLVLDQDDISFYPFFGRVRNLKLSDITSIKEKEVNGNITSIKCFKMDDEVFSLDANCEGFKKFTEITANIARK